MNVKYFTGPLLLQPPVCVNTFSLAAAAAKAEQRAASQRPRKKRRKR